jgi:hypothetical protein
MDSTHLQLCSFFVVLTWTIFSRQQQGFFFQNVEKETIEWSLAIN